jgi:hypothetical protein
MDKGDSARGPGTVQEGPGSGAAGVADSPQLRPALIKAGKKNEARSELDQLAKLGDKFPAQAEVARLQKGL